MILRGAVTLMLLTAPLGGGEIPLASSGLDLGYRQMYNLQFAEAHQTFGEWKRLHPQDPLGPVSDGAAYLFAEFDRLHILQSELFVENEKFLTREKQAPDAAAKRALQGELARGEQLAAQTLARSPWDAQALFAKLLSLGLRADYEGLIEKRYMTALANMKTARVVADQLLAVDSSCYDAYLAAGVENYMLSLKPLAVRWLLRLGGSRTDKAEGIKKLRLTAEKGHYLLPYARLLLAVAALRDQDTAQARQILEVLAREFPRNRLYRGELARLQ
jgi:hypothetical protein